MYIKFSDASSVARFSRFSFPGRGDKPGQIFKKRKIPSIIEYQSSSPNWSSVREYNIKVELLSKASWKIIININKLYNININKYIINIIIKIIINMKFSLFDSCIVSIFLVWGE